MLIAAFARETGLGQDTVRFYVRRGLLRPGRSAKGGRNPYQWFSDADVQTARVIRLGQAVGLSLTEIGVLLADDRSGALSAARVLAAMRAQRARLLARVADLQAMADYLDAKIDWMMAGETGPEPAWPLDKTVAPEPLARRA